MPTYMLTVQTYLDQLDKCYKKIIVINSEPQGNLRNFVTRLRPNKLSPFKQNSNCGCSQSCIYAFKNSDGCNKLLTVDDIPTLFNLIMQNGYTIDSGLTKMMNKSKVQVSNDLLCFITI